jgi:hypothetical protein
MKGRIERLEKALGPGPDDRERVEEMTRLYATAGSENRLGGGPGLRQVVSAEGTRSLHQLHGLAVPGA